MAFKTSSKQKLSTISAISSSVGTGASGPVILSVYVTDSSYVNLDDTAVSTSGGYIKLTGTGFVTGCIAYVNGVAATTTFVSSTEIRAVVPALASGTYSLMMFNSAGSGSLWATGLVTSGFPTVTTSSYSNSGNVLNIQLLASGDGTLVYTLQSGSTLPAGVTLSSSGVLSGTASALTSATVVSFTILVNDAQLQTVQQAITLSLTFGDVYFNSTVLAIQSDVTPFISDASSNALVLTPAGSVKADQFNPFQDGFYSTLLPGSSYLSMPSKPELNFGTGDFTVELWTYALAVTGAQLVSANSSGGLFIGWDGANGFGVGRASVAWDNIVGGAQPLNVWMHLAVCRSGTTLRLFKDGQQYGSNFTNSLALDLSLGGTQIGAQNGAYNPNAYISNLRVVKGVALYTEAFVPPTQPLTTTEAAVTYVAPATVDYLVVAGGGGGGQIIGGGGGAGGMLTGSAFAVAANTALTITVGNGGAAGSGTVGGSGGNSVFSTITATGGGGGGVWAGGAGVAGGSGGGGAGADGAGGAGGAATPAGQGNAGGAGNSGRRGGGGGGAGAVGIAATTTAGGSGGAGLSSSITGTATYYAGGGGSNGDAAQISAGGQGGGGQGVGGNSSGTNCSTSGIANSGGGGGGGGNSAAAGAGGTGVVIIRYADTSSPAVTTGNPDIIISGGYRIYRFTQSGTIKFRNTSSPAVTAAQTSLLTCQSNRFKDSSATASAITVAGTPKITQVIPYTLPTNTYGSGYFNGTTDYITTATSLNFGMGTGNFTIEAWIYPLVAAGSILETTGGIQIGWNGTTAFGIAQRGVAWRVTGSAPVLNTWNHIAIVRSGTGTNQIAVYMNGVIALGTDGTDYASTTGTLTLGGTNPSGGNYYTGYISNVRVLKGITVYTGAFTPPTAPLAITQSSGTNITAVTGTQTNLLTLQTKQAHNNNTYQETSGYNNALTVAGTPSQGTFSPFSPAGWSVRNSVSGQGLSITSNAASFGISADFTVELWVNLDQAATGNETWFEFTGVARLIFGRTTTGIRLYNDGLDGNFSYTFAKATWYHIALVRVSNYMRVYINGVLANTPYFNQTTWSGTGISLLRNSDGAESVTPMYISNFRIVKGTAVYTAAFTPSIAPLTAITNTTLLTCQDNRFVDNSINNSALTLIGVPSIQAFSPFKPSVAYDPVIHGGSTYFNGSTDYLTAPVNTSLSFGTGATVSAMTAECWFYVNTAISTDQTIVSQYASGAAGWSLRVYSSVMRVALTGDSTIITGTTTLAPYTWYHVALSGSAGSWKLFLNGVQESITLTGSVTMGDAAPVTLGRLSNVSYFNGYISNVVVTKGIAKYTGNFYVPTAPTPRTNNTVLLLNSTSAAIIDASGRNNMLTVGDAKIYTAVKKYGAGSMYFDGTGDYIAIPSSPNLNFGTGDFTVEAWVYLTAQNTYECILASGTTTFTTNATAFRVDSGTPIVTVNPGGASNSAYGPAVSLNVWTHIAATRSGTSLRVFTNGVSGTMVSVSSAFSFGDNGSRIGGGTWDTTNSNLYGYIDDLRITKGVARYTANFTPPTAISVS